MKNELCVCVLFLQIRKKKNQTLWKSHSVPFIYTEISTAFLQSAKQQNSSSWSYTLVIKHIITSISSKPASWQVSLESCFVKTNWQKCFCRQSSERSLLNTMKDKQPFSSFFIMFQEKRHAFLLLLLFLAWGNIFSPTDFWRQKFTGKWFCQDVMPDSWVF